MPQASVRADHPAAKRLAEQIGSAAPISIQVDAAGPNGQCYWNADSYVVTHGGSVVHGWQLLSWGNLYVIALHHAVVSTPDGKLLDVTSPDVATERRTTFSIDERIKPPRDYPAYIDSPFLTIRDTAGTRAMALAMSQQTRAARRRMAEIRRQGVSFKFGAPTAVTPTPEMVAAHAEYEASRDAVEDAFRLLKIDDRRIASRRR